MVFQKKLTFQTGRHGEIRHLTPDVGRAVALSGIRTGFVHVYNVGSTGALTTTEYEPGLEKDVPLFPDRMVPENGRYRHDETWHE